LWDDIGTNTIPKFLKGSSLKEKANPNYYNHKKYDKKLRKIR